MPDPSIGPWNHPKPSSSKPRRVDTSSLSGIEAASRGPTTSQKLSSQPTKVDRATTPPPVTRDPKPTSTRVDIRADNPPPPPRSTGGPPNTVAYQTQPPVNPSSGGPRSSGRDPQPSWRPAGNSSNGNSSTGNSILNNNRFLEINDALPESPSRNASTGNSILNNNRFLEINDALPERSAGKSILQNNRFLEINDALPKTDSEVPASPVEAAATDLQNAIDLRNSQPQFVQQYYQPQVNLARENLVEVVQEDIETGVTPPRPPHFDTTPVSVQRANNSSDIVEQFADDPVLGAHVLAAVEAANVNIEVDDTLELVNDAGSPSNALHTLDNVYEDLSPEAQERVLADDNVQQVFEDVADDATVLLTNEPPTDFQIMDAVRVSADELDNTLADVDNPDLAAEVVRHSLPAFDNAIAINAEREDKFGVDYDGLVTESTLDILGSLSDRIVGARSESDALAGLTRLALQGTTNVTAPFNAGVPDTSGGKGITLALSIVDAHVANGSPESQEKATLAVEHLIADFDTYANSSDSPLASAVSAFGQHTEELNYYITFASDETPSEDLQAAIEQYIDDKNKEWLADDDRQGTWESELERLESDLADHGATLLLTRDLLSEYAHLTPSGESDLAAVADNESDNFAVAASIALDSDEQEHAEILSQVDIDSALEYFGTLKNVNRATGLSTKLVNWQLNSVVATSIGEVVADDPQSIANARDAINSLRTERFAEVLKIDGGLEELNSALDALEETLPDGSPIPPEKIAERFEAFEQKLGGIKSFSDADSALGAFADIGFYRTSVDFATSLGYEPSDSAIGRFGTSKAVGKGLAIAGVAWSAYGVAKDIKDGEYAQAGLGAIGVGGAALPFLTSAAWASPVSAVIAVGVVLGTYQLNRVQDSNKFTGEDARNFLGELGFDDDAARALADRSGKKHHVVDALIEYGKLNGLSYQESIDWVNSLDKDQIDYVRDRFHHYLDDTGGSLENFNESNESDADIINIYESTPIQREPTSAAVADWILEQRDIPRP